MKNTLRIERDHVIARLLRDLTLAMTGCYLLSLLARHHYLFDLFSHFTFQYALGAILLSIAFLCVRHKTWAVIAAIVALLNGGEIILHTKFFPLNRHDTGLTIMQYNRNVQSDDGARLTEWITDNTEKVDIIVLQEASVSSVEMADNIGAYYPYRLNFPSRDAFGMVIMSRYPFLETDQIPFADQPYRNFYLRFVVQPDALEEPVSIYAIHTIPPMGDKQWKQRNAELDAVSQKINEDTIRNRIMIGDLNITPYSPFFSDALKQSKLTYGVIGFLPLPTWPTSTIPWLAQIPIDHILFSDSLIPLNAYRLKPAFSDHYAVIMSLSEK